MTSRLYVLQASDAFYKDDPNNTTEFVVPLNTTLKKNDIIQLNYILVNSPDPIEPASILFENDITFWLEWGVYTFYSNRQANGELMVGFLYPRFAGNTDEPIIKRSNPIHIPRGVYTPERLCSVFNREVDKPLIQTDDENLFSLLRKLDTFPFFQTYSNNSPGIVLQRCPNKDMGISIESNISTLDFNNFDHRKTPFFAGEIPEGEQIEFTLGSKPRLTYDADARVFRFVFEKPIVSKTGQPTVQKGLPWLYSVSPADRNAEAIIDREGGVILYDYDAPFADFCNKLNINPVPFTWNKTSDKSACFKTLYGDSTVFSSYFSFDAETPPKPEGTLGDKVWGADKFFGIVKNYSTQELQGQTPDTTISPFFVILSDILDENRLSIHNANLPALGIVPKNFWSNNFFYSYEAQQEIVVQKDRDVDAVRLVIREPDLTRPNYISSNHVISIKHFSNS